MYTEYLTGTLRLGLKVDEADQNFINFLQEHSMKEAESIKDEGKKLTTQFNYDILLNRAYSDAFAYVPSFLKGRLFYIASEDYEEKDDGGTLESHSPLTRASFKQKPLGDCNDTTLLAKKCQSDYVRLVVELAYLSTKDAKTIKLTTEDLMDRVKKIKEDHDKKNVSAS